MHKIFFVISSIVIADQITKFWIHKNLAFMTYLDIFPLRGLISDNWEELSLLEKIIDYFWHLTLPVLAMVIGGFASLTMLTKNSFLDEINKQYVFLVDHIS